jgi:glutamine amidotransferase-like uncharacterized protein
MNFQRYLLATICTITLALQIGCAQPSSDSSAAAEEAAPVPPDTSKVEPQNPSSPTPIPPVSHETYGTNILLFNGVGISTSDWQTTEKIIQSMGIAYRLVNSSQLNAMSLAEMKTFGMILVPGGKAGTITGGLKAATRVRVRQAVRDGGVAYLGVCAGAFMAVEAGAEGNNTTGYGFPVVEGKHLPMWYPNGNTSAIAAVTPVKFADGSSRHLVWYGGPSTPEWTGGVVARYNNGKPAISQTWFHKGWVIVTGPHPEAPQGWRNTAGHDPDGLDYDIMQDLITATMKRQALPVF